MAPQKYLFIFLILLPAIVFGQENIWSLQECIAYAQEHNLVYQRSRLNIEIEDIDLKQSKLNLLPSLSGDANYNWNYGRSVDPTTYTFQTGRIITSSIGLNSNVLLFNGLVRQNIIKRSKLEQQSAQASATAVFDDITINIVQAYLNALLYQEQVQISQYQLRLTQEQLLSTEKLISAGSIPEGNILEVQAQLANDRFSLVNVENQVRLALLNLQLLLNLEPTEDFSIERPDLSDEDIEPLAATPEAIYQNALNLNSEIEQAQYGLLIAESNVSIAKGGYYPILTLYGNINSSYSDIRKLYDVVPAGFDTIGAVLSTGEFVVQPSFETVPTDFPFMEQLDENLSQNIGLSLSIPIFNRLQNRNNVQIAKISRDIAGINLEQQRNLLKTEIYQAYYNAEAAYQQFVAADENVKAMQQSFEYMQKRYDQGLTKPLDLFLAQNNFQIAQINKVRAKYELLLAVKVLDVYQGKSLNL